MQRVRKTAKKRKNKESIFWFVPDKSVGELLHKLIDVLPVFSYTR